jgi:lanosterol synthase
VLFLETVVSTAKDTEMSVRRRGEAKQANGSANGSIKHEDVIDLKTDHTRWRMKNVDGRQTWHYLESDEELKAWPMTSADKYYLGMDTVGCNIQILLHNTF